MDIDDTNRDLNCIKSEIAGFPKFFVIHESSGYVVEVEPETYSGLQKIKEGEGNKLTSEERAKLRELQNYLNQLPPLNLEYNEDYGFLLGGSINVSQACNFSCVYCYANKGTYTLEKPKLMDKETIRKAIDFLFEKSPYGVSIVFFGGEPLLNFPAIKEGVLYAEQKARETKKPVFFNVTTNGYLLTPEVAEFVLDHPFNVIVSMDGPKEIHDHNRPFADNSPTYNVVAKNLKHLVEEAKKRGKLHKISVRATVLPEQLNRVYDIYHHIKTEFGVLNVGVELATLSDSVVTKGHIDTYLDQLKKIAVEEVETFGELGTVVYVKFKQIIQDVYRGRVSSFHCGAGKGSVAIDVNGNIYPCHRFVSMKNFELSHIENFEWEHLKRFELQKYNFFNHEPCKSCWLKLYCHDFCFYENTIYTGRGFIPPALKCYYSRESFKIGLWLYSRLWDEYEEEFEKVLEKSISVPSSDPERNTAPELERIESEHITATI
ncbi:radical SAM protein [Thermococcus sp. GR7]|uniref:radical SAM/SPASM domain-containing protein n=1 Tax=unclassified Thermococcus TaxID=2627626 RepID=UPI00142F769A|nr:MULTISPECIES: radical SAM protein [unclassified Thermococcus]NJE46172.1 radical SAM protein [Thermococcus sp. GR7]NJE78192.1 radical SAM protein [Thermococcus sp. GR4]NJF23967.1 radical SAM protein [Thermococcus sp. GR5]